MKRILQLSLLLLVPFMLKADHGRDRLNGKWISPYFDKQIRLTVKRHEIRIKGLTNRGWTSFQPVRRNLFEDCDGNSVRINNIHDMVYRSAYGERITFVKKGHVHHNHNCSHGCSIGDDYFDYGDSYTSGYDSNSNGYSGYDNYWTSTSISTNNDYYRRDRRDRRARNVSSIDRISGRYHIRNTDKFVVLENTRNGLKSKGPKGIWTVYNKNRFRKNEYLDDRGNRYLVGRDGRITWTNRERSLTKNLERRR